MIDQGAARKAKEEGRKANSADLDYLDLQKTIEPMPDNPWPEKGEADRRCRQDRLHLSGHRLNPQPSARTDLQRHSSDRQLARSDA